AGGVDYYLLQMSSDSTFTTGFVFNGSVGTNSLPLSPSLTPGKKYFWRVVGVNSYGVSFYPAAPYWFTPTSVVGVEPSNGLSPKHYSLSQNYPNPFNPRTEFEFEIKDMGAVTLIISDALGREVATLIDGVLRPGQYRASWDAGNFPSGTYFY